MSCPLKMSVKLILITEGKAAILSCQPRQCPAPVSAAESLLSRATGSVWGKRRRTSGKCFFAAVEESPGASTEKMLFHKDCCGSDVSKTSHLATTGHDLHEKLFAETQISPHLSGANWNCTTLNRENVPSTKGRKKITSSARAFLGRSFSSDWHDYRVILSSDWNIHKLVYNLMLQVKFS